MYQVIFENEYYKQYYFLRTPFMYEISAIANQIPNERCRVSIYNENNYKERLKRIDHITNLEARGYINDIRVFINFFKKQNREIA